MTSNSNIGFRQLLIFALVVFFSLNLIGCGATTSKKSTTKARPTLHKLSWGKPVTPPHAENITIYWAPQFQDEMGEIDPQITSIIINIEIRLNKSAEQNGKHGAIELWKKLPDGDQKLAGRSYYINKGDKINYQDFIVSCSNAANPTVPIQSSRAEETSKSVASEYYAFEPIEKIKSNIESIACARIE